MLGMEGLHEIIFPGQKFEGSCPSPGLEGRDLFGITFVIKT
jgi:hypothetical protein